MAVERNLIPVLSKDIIARNDENGILLFQVRTDEMYLIPFDAYYSFLVHCDGSSTLDQIIGKIEITDELKDMNRLFDEFIDALIKRDIISLW